MFPLPLLLFTVGQAIHSLTGPYSQTRFEQCYYNLTKYIFGLYTAVKTIKAKPSFIGVVVRSDMRNRVGDKQIG